MSFNAERGLVYFYGLQPICRFVVFASACLLSNAVYPQARIDYVAFNGQLSPDGNGILTTGFGNFSMNDFGDIAVEISLSGTLGGTADDRAIIRGNEFGLSMVIREGQAPPDGNGVFGSFPGTTRHNNVGAVLYATVLSGSAGGTTDNEALYLTSGGVTSLIARRGHTVAGGNGVHGAMNNVSFNDTNEAFFESFLTGTSGGDTDNRALFFNSGGVEYLVARKGQTTPEGSGTFQMFSNRGMNSQGQILFNADLSGPTATNRGMYLYSNHSLQMIARKGSVAPDGDGTMTTLSFPSINNHGEIAFHAETTGNIGGTSTNRSLWILSNSAYTLAARRGNAAPDGNGTFLSFGDVRLLDSGDLLFSSSLTGTVGGSADNEGLFKYHAGQVSTIMRESQAAPDGNGVVSLFSSSGRVHNNHGVVVADTFFSGTSGGSSDDRGLLMSDGIDTMLVVREGRQAYGQTMTSTSISGLSVNDMSQVVYIAVFANGARVLEKFTPELHYRATSSGNWDDRMNWTLSTPPAFAHDCFINPSNDLTVFGPSADRTIRSLELGAGAGVAELQLVDSSTLTADQGFFIRSNGILSGSGTIAATVFQDGRISPGISAGSLTIDGNWNFVSGILDIELGGIGLQEFDRLTVLGDATIVGELQVSLLGGFQLSAGDSFLIADIQGSRTGTFAGLGEGDLVGNFGGRDLFISYLGGNGNGILLYAAIPEPFASLALGTLALAHARRRQRPRSAC